MSLEGTKNIHSLLDEEKQKQARKYEKENRLLGLAGRLLSFFILLVFFHSGFSAFLARDLFRANFFLSFIIYVAILDICLFIGSFPLSFYSGYVHEHKWKFSNHTVRSWLWEKNKSFLVGLVLMWIVFGLLYWILDTIPGYWWLAAGGGSALISVVFATFFPVIILPIFNKYTPIDNEEMTSALEAILNRGGLKSSGFFKEDMSRQTKKENAFLAGLGKTRRVVLGDNLMDNMDIPEIEAILAHEVGHYKHRHIWKSIVLGTVQQLIVFFFVNLLMKAAFPQFLLSSRENLSLLPYFAICAGAVSLVLFGPLGNALSRSFERQADRYALENIGDSSAYISALAGLANRNLANAYPEKWVKILYYSHPPIGERLEKAENYPSDSHGV
jgi:STE24 endopeptidase